MRLLIGFTLPLVALFMTQCSSMPPAVPEGAPPVFQNARMALDNVSTKDLADRLPRTVALAHKHWSQAVDQYQKRKHADAESEAQQTLTLSNELLEYDRLRQDWESDPKTFSNMLATLQGHGPGARFAKLESTQIRVPVAYFDTDSSDSPTYTGNVVRDLADLLRKDPSFRVLVVGHTDRRGTSTHNEALGMARAKTVADTLRSYGVPDSQIAYQSQGESEASASSSPSYLLDRYVSAVIQL